MPGKLCDGEPKNKTMIGNSQDFCAGVADRAASAAATNPYDQAQNPRGYADWQRGADYCASLAGQQLTRANMACCQAGIGTIVPI